MRGQHILFTDLIEPTIMAVPKAEGIGRSKELISKRNKRLCYRYYYYVKVLDKHYPATIALLSDEFDLSEIRIITQLTENNILLKNIIQREKPSIKELTVKYPWMVW